MLTYTQIVNINCKIKCESPGQFSQLENCNLQNYKLVV